MVKHKNTAKGQYNDFKQDLWPILKAFCGNSRANQGPIMSLNVYAKNISLTDSSEIAVFVDLGE